MNRLKSIAIATVLIATPIMFVPLLPVAAIGSSLLLSTCSVLGGIRILTDLDIEYD